MCNCGNTITTSSICTNCVQTDCACPIKDFSTDCILYTGEDLPCTDIKQGTIMTELVTQLDTYICTLQTQILNSARLVNVGVGTEIYKGVDGLGRKEIRSVSSTNNIITIGLSTEEKELEIGLDTEVLKEFVQDNQVTYSAANVGSGAGVYKEAIRINDNVEFSLRKIKSTQSSFSIVEDGDEIVITTDGSETKVQQGSGISVTGIGTFVSPYVVTNTAPNIPVSIAQGLGISVTGTYPNFTVTSTSTSADGSETKINSGSSIIVTGVGTTANPYIVNNSSPDQVVTLTPGGATTITGTYPNFTISSINTIADGSETKINNGTTTTVSGAGTIASPYIVEVVNLQKVISYPADFTGTNYTLTSADNNYSILINNASTAVTITIPTGLSSKISVGFIQQGTADISFVSSGTTINTPVGLKIKGQNYNAYIEKVGITETFHLLGNLKV